MVEEKPYIEKKRIVVDTFYNPKYGDNRVCECGHNYYRHFDSYENMEACGCKYCSCYTFKQKLETPELFDGTNDALNALSIKG